MKNPKAIGITILVIAIIAVGFLFLRGPKPIIEIKGEPLWTGADHGTFLTPMLLNTTLAGIVSSLLIIALAFFATRNMQLIPKGIQNAVEAVTELMYNMCVQLAGEKNGRRFFSVAATIFVFIWIANWFSLTPFFNTIGQFHEVSPEHTWHEEAQVFSNTSGVKLIFPFALGADSPHVEFEVDEAEVDAINEEIALAKQEGASQEVIDGLQQQSDEALLEAREVAYAVALPKAAGLDLDYSSCEALLVAAEEEECVREINLEHAPEAAAKLEEDNKEIGVIFPYLRGFNTDLNSPLSLAIISVCFIEFWGITALGVFKYGGKFFRNPFKDPIGAFVGLLEFVAEFARLISFTFRLFGNMLAGEILLLVMTFLIPFLVALPFYGLEVFVGAIQGFVFFALTVAFGALAVASHDEHDEHDEDGHEAGNEASGVAAPAH